MKKLISLILCFVLFLCSCAGTQTDIRPEESNDEKVETEVKITDEDVDSLLTVYSQVLVETFGAETDFLKPYRSDDMNVYYLVSNFKTVAEVKDYIANYITADCFNAAEIDEDFTEEDGELLLVRGARGYGYYGIDPTSWEYIDNISVKVQFCILDTPVEETYCVVEFIQDNGTWKINGFTLPEGY
ncbi:MAG: hypothetical protein IJL30_04110 [Clostridia bacterium]|nr:hypothetical protein [Clostridia bacterium]